MHTGPIPAIISADITLNLVVTGGSGVPVPAEFAYSPHEPFGVTVIFHAGGHDVRWVFARNLLSDGVGHPAGDGDVRCWPTADGDRRIVCIALHSPNGHALLEAPAAQIMDFLHRTYEVVAPGTEASHLDIDAMISELLGTSAP